MNGISSEILYLLDPAQGLCIPEGNIDQRDMASDDRRPGVGATFRCLPVRVTQCVKQATSEALLFLICIAATSRDRSSRLKEWNKRQQLMTDRESDDRIVPLTAEDQSAGSKSGNTDAEKAIRITRDRDRASPVLRDGTAVLTRLDRISQRASSQRDAVFNNLFSLITKELLWDAWFGLKGGKAPGIDGVTLEDYGENLRSNLPDLLDRLHRGSYHPKPSLRKLIPKGNGKTRPLGIASLEDKLVQRAIVLILERIYEVDFHETSYGYRPGKSCHEALAVLGGVIATRKVNWISDADIKGFFDNVCHERLEELLRIRISDPKLLRLIHRFLKAGVMTDGRLEATEEGVPQGASLSPLLANVYLHYVLDQWFERDVKPRMRGECYLLRFADDFICCFQDARDAERYQTVLPKRLGRYSLEVAEDKTKLIRFGRFARASQTRSGAPDTFDFLGFTHYCGLSRAGKFKLKRKTSGKKLRVKLREMRLWFHKQLSTPVGEMWRVLNAKLRGHYQYYGINDNWPMLMAFRSKVRVMAKRHLSRRSQKSYVTWDDFNRFCELHPLANPKRLKDLIALHRELLSRRGK
jgi:group II intron reverse transcriptase/maturase